MSTKRSESKAALWEGFVAGIASPFRVFSRPPRYRVRYPHPVAEAWQIVGRQLTDAFDAEEREHEAAFKGASEKGAQRRV